MDVDLKNELLSFIKNPTFPCVMAKAVAATGEVKVERVTSINQVLKDIYRFVDEFRSDSDKLRSFILVFEPEGFEEFEKRFWTFLRLLDQEDKKNYKHDARVSSDPAHENFSFSIKEEAFFILALHPDSPRWARRFRYPAIVFNAHQQFEKLRSKGIFTKVRDLIRHRDKVLQGSVNPMVSDFGERSEVFQYTGRVYPETSPIPL